jgi:hypothetical protein
MKPTLDLNLNVHYQLLDEQGNVVEEWWEANLVCLEGKYRLLLAATPKSVNDFDRICIGIGTTAAADTDTTLETEVARATGETSNPTPGIWQNEVTFAPGVGTGNITESALDYQDAPSGAILARQVFTARAKTASLSLRVTWSVS